MTDTKQNITIDVDQSIDLASTELAPEQQTVFDAYREGSNVFVTGPGGTGKSHLIREIYRDANDRGKRIQVCAMTGCAALLLECKAKTIHSWAGIGLAKGDPATIVTAVCHNKWKRKAWTDTDILVIDEISMMSSHMFNLLDQIGRMARRNPDKPFGGLHVIFSGDFFQLPPVGDKENPATSEFCFESPSWDSTFEEIVELKRLFRQRDARYGKVLNEIREGRLTRSSFNILTECVGRPQDDSVIEAPVLFPTRRSVDSVNSTKMRQLPGNACTYTAREAKDVQMTDSQIRINSKYTAEQKQREVDYLITNSMTDKVLDLKLGAQVMCVANLDMDGPGAIANGSQGVIVGWSHGLPMVRFRNGTERVVGYHARPSETLVGVAVEQIPLIFAWAISIHKAQGTTLEMARINIGASVFECGQTYVALSRVKDLSGLYIDSFDPKKIRVNRKVKAYYERLRSHSIVPPPAPDVPAVSE